MKVFIYRENNVINVGSVAPDLDIKEVAKSIVPNGIKFWIKEVSELPSEPQETWILSDDGSITIDIEKLAQLKRDQLLPLSPIEFDIKIHKNGLYDAVQELIKDNFNLRITYNRATFFSRTDPFIDQAQIALNLTNEQVDEMWMN